MRKVRQRCGEIYRYAIITGRAEYNHVQYMDGRRKIMQWYADYMDELEGELGEII